MKLSLPGASVLHEYLLVYGERWVEKTYNIDGDKIDEILYGAALPTEERQKKKWNRALKEDDERVAFMNEMYRKDHFIWDKPNKVHLRCQNAVEKPLPERTEKFLADWSKMYKSFIERDMKYNGNEMRVHGWQLGERVINKTTSRTTDDNIQDRFMQIFLDGTIRPSNAIKHQIDRDFDKQLKGHEHEDENFLENISNHKIDHVKSVIKHVRQKKQEY